MKSKLGRPDEEVVGPEAVEGLEPALGRLEVVGEGVDVRRARSYQAPAENPYPAFFLAVVRHVVSKLPTVNPSPLNRSGPADYASLAPSRQPLARHERTDRVRSRSA